MENNQGQLKKIVKTQNKECKAKTKEIRKLSKMCSPKVEADFIDITKKIGKGYKMHGLPGHKANNEYILLLIDEIQKIISGVLTKRTTFNAKEYNSLIDELNECLDTRSVINVSSSISDDVALRAIGNAFTKKLRRLEEKREILVAKFKAKDEECKANPTSAALRSEKVQIYNEIKAIDLAYDKIANIVDANNLNAYVEAAKEEAEKLKAYGDKVDVDSVMAEKEIMEMEAKMNSETRKMASKDMDAEMESFADSLDRKKEKNSETKEENTELEDNLKKLNY